MRIITFKSKNIPAHKQFNTLESVKKQFLKIYDLKFFDSKSSNILKSITVQFSLFDSRYVTKKRQHTTI